MPDSRSYSLKLLVKFNKKLYKRINWQSKITLFVFSLLIGFAGVYFLKDDSFTDPQTNVMFILFFAITLAILLSATKIIKLLGTTGNNVLMRLMGLIIMVIAVEFFLSGFKPIIKDILGS